jgi:hypothetical protein
MDYFAGLDVSVKDTSVCIVDDAGKIVREVKIASEPEALLRGEFTMSALPSMADIAGCDWEPLCARNGHHGSYSITSSARIIASGSSGNLSELCGCSLMRSIFTSLSSLPFRTTYRL